MLLLKQEAWRRRCRSNLLDWCIEALRPYQQSPALHHILLIQKLEQIASGAIDRLMIYMPPRHAKSFYTSRLFVPWFLAQDASKSIIAASHTYNLAEGFGRFARNLIEQHKETLGFSLEPDRTAAGHWLTDRGGGYLAAGVGKAIAGNPGDLLLIDDPVSNKAEAESEVQRDSVWDWYKNDLYTRQQPNAKIILIMTRWHEDDLGGRLLTEMAGGGDQWEILKLPALANDPNDPLGRQTDEALWPEWMSKEALLRIRRTLGEREFGALYQQDPRPPGGSFFEVQNVLVDGEAIAPPNLCDGVYAVVDTAVKTGSKNDGLGVTYFALCNQVKFHPLTVLDWDITQIEGAMLEAWLPTVFQKLEQLAQQCNARYGNLGVYIEDKASGTILLQQVAMRPQLGRAHSIDSKLTAVGKDERAINVSGYVQRQMVKLSKPAYDKMTHYKNRYGNHFLIQVFRFQLGVKDQQDDLLDTFTYGIAIGLGNSEGY